MPRNGTETGPVQGDSCRSSQHANMANEVVGDVRDFGKGHRAWVEAVRQHSCSVAGQRADCGNDQFSERTTRTMVCCMWNMCCWWTAACAGSSVCEMDGRSGSTLECRHRGKRMCGNGHMDAKRKRLRRNQRVKGVDGTGKNLIRRGEILPLGERGGDGH